MNTVNCPNCKRVGSTPERDGLVTCRTCYTTSHAAAWKPLQHKIGTRGSERVCEVCHGAGAHLFESTCDGPAALCNGPQVVVWGHEMPHEAVTIIANEAGLRALQAACRAALAKGRAGFMASPTDGEGYMLRLVLQDPLHADLAVPYRVPYYGWDPVYPRPGQMLPTELGEGPQELALRVIAGESNIVKPEPA